MHFSFLLLTVSSILGSAFATEPGNNALHAGLSDDFEIALHKKYGPTVFDGFAAKECKWSKCHKLMPDVQCIYECFWTRDNDDFECLNRCEHSEMICPCDDCLDPVLAEWLFNIGYCFHTNKAKLFSKVHLGIATPREVERAQKLGFKPASAEL